MQNIGATYTYVHLDPADEVEVKANPDPVLRGVRVRIDRPFQRLEIRADSDGIGALRRLHHELGQALAEFDASRSTSAVRHAG